MDSEADPNNPVSGGFLTPVIIQVYNNNSFLLSIQTDGLWSWSRHNSEQQAVDISLCQEIKLVVRGLCCWCSHESFGWKSVGT